MTLEQILKKQTDNTLHIIAGENNRYTSLDLSVTNTDLNEFDITDAKAFEGYINNVLQRSDATVAYGGYNETRDIYSRSLHFYTENKRDERNIHLGLDLWCAVNTPVFAALEGTIHSYNNNTNFGDYGPTIILEHQLYGHTFYALYGHLSLVSLEGIKVGDRLCKGAIVGYLGDASVNGDYAPHLHYQLIKDMEGNLGDFRGVTSLNDQAQDLENCPDPNLLLKIV
jgi:murein DD-endopeptidase MepM/ murein hydrolase activator NlpD